jgi:hypothetical protein
MTKFQQGNTIVIKMLNKHENIFNVPYPHSRFFLFFFLKIQGDLGDTDLVQHFIQHLNYYFVALLEFCHRCLR